MDSSFMQQQAFMQMQQPGMPQFQQMQFQMQQLGPPQEFMQHQQAFMQMQQVGMPHQMQSFGQQMQMQQMQQMGMQQMQMQSFGQPQHSAMQPPTLWQPQPAMQNKVQRRTQWGNAAPMFASECSPSSRLNKEKQDTLRAQFGKFDRDSDNSLSFEEMKALLHPMAERDARKLFEEVDKSGNGLLDFDEFVGYIFSEAGQARELEPWRTAALHDAFQMCDRNRNGSITAPELPNLLYYAELDPELAPYILDKYNIDKDEGLDFLEVLQFMKDMRACADQATKHIRKQLPSYASAMIELKHVLELLEAEEKDMGLPDKMLQGMLLRASEDRHHIDFMTPPEFMEGMQGLRESNRDVKAARVMAVCQGAVLHGVDGPDEAEDGLDGAMEFGKSAAEAVSDFESEFGVQFVWQGWSDGDIHGDAITENEVLRCLDQQHEESLYNAVKALPRDFLDKGVLTKLVVVHRLRHDKINSLLNGLGGKDTLYFNIRSRRNMHGFWSTFHHELYHMIDHNDNRVNDPNDKAWRALNPPGFKYQNEGGTARPHYQGFGTGSPGFITSYAMSALVEDKAETFQNWVAERKRFEKLFDEDGGDILKGKTRLLMKETIKFCPGFQTDAWVGNLLD